MKKRICRSDYNYSSSYNQSSLMVDERKCSNILYLVAKHICTPGTRADYNPGEFIVVFNPIHRNRLLKEGWTKQDIKQYLYENADRSINQ